MKEKDYIFQLLIKRQNELIKKELKERENKKKIEEQLNDKNYKPTKERIIFLKQMEEKIKNNLKTIKNEFELINQIINNKEV